MQFNKKKTADIHVRVEQELRDRIYEKAKEIGCTKTSLIISMINHCLAEMDKDGI